ncbi:hypothetical protein [uncultured Cedecea sp.]|uniref:hypothetical protein n=1 Tax=uncultured Cedecea sp. TaxID=988762 RepID=UPI0026221D28|nr:hypothetical protein [uncultured Cedecea sp.]
MSNLSNRLKVLMRADEVPMSDAWGELIDDLKASEVELLACREAQGKPVERVNSEQMQRVCIEATRHLDKYTAMAKEVNKLLGRAPAPPLPAVPDELEDGCGYKDQYIDGWNACRSAMLATAPKPEVGDNTHADGQIQCATTDFVRGRL